mmetsp:Transcript_32053/g.72643  ORF Transcript_32053/g.72643 Transcript_32053/m.72643 type:complete len:281 (-) Transcript_32053:1588-2430(-)
MAPVVRRHEDEEVHPYHVEEQGLPHLLGPQEGLGNDEHDLLHGGHLVVLPLPFRPAELPERVDVSLVPLLERLQVEVSTAGHAAAANARGRGGGTTPPAEALEVPNLLVQLRVVRLEPLRGGDLRLQLELEAVPLGLEGVAPSPEAVALGHDYGGDGGVVVLPLRGALRLDRRGEGRRARRDGRCVGVQYALERVGVRRVCRGHVVGRLGSLLLRRRRGRGNGKLQVVLEGRDEPFLVSGRPLRRRELFRQPLLLLGRLCLLPPLPDQVGLDLAEFCDED